MEKGLLDGIIVLDLTRVLAGPYCGMILADMALHLILHLLAGFFDQLVRLLGFLDACLLISGSERLVL